MPAMLSSQAEISKTPVEIQFAVGSIGVGPVRAVILELVPFFCSSGLGATRWGGGDKRAAALPSRAEPPPQASIPNTNTGAETAVDGSLEQNIFLGDGCAVTTAEDPADQTGAAAKVHAQRRTCARYVEPNKAISKSTWLGGAN